MGFYFKESIGFGPFRTSFSKSGAHTSADLRGFYVNAGPDGFSYRQNGSGIDSADVGQFVDSSSEQLLQQLNACAAQARYAPVIAVIATLACFVCLFQWGAVVAIGITLMGACAVSFFNKRDQMARRFPIVYKLDEPNAIRLQSLEMGCEELRHSERIWQVGSDTVASDWESHGGASRKRWHVLQAPPRHLVTNVKPFALFSEAIALFFMPDSLLVYRSGRYRAIPYDALTVSVTPVGVPESEAVPSDTHIVGRTWLCVRADGSPDTRSTRNRQIPIVRYQQVDIHSTTGLNIRLHVSNPHSAAEFAAAIHSYGHGGEQQTADGGKEPQTLSELQESAFQTLGIQPNASKEEIKSAYHRLAQQNHPDKFATLAPEFHDLAENRMKEINAAYHRLMGNRATSTLTNHSNPAS